MIVKNCFIQGGIRLFSAIWRSAASRTGLLLILIIMSIVGVQFFGLHLTRRMENKARRLDLRLAHDGKISQVASTITYKQIRNDLNRYEVGLLLSIGLGLTGSVIALARLRRVAGAISKLVVFSNAVAAGDYRRRIKIKNDYKLALLGDRLNELARSLMRNQRILEEQAEMVAGMLSATRTTSYSSDVDECGKAIAKALCSYAGASDVCVYLKNDDAALVTAGRSGRRIGADGKRIAVHVADCGEYVILAENEKDGESGGHLVGVPLSDRGKILGTIVARFGKELTREQIALGSPRADILGAFALQSAAALSNIDLRERAAEHSATLDEWSQHTAALLQVMSAISPACEIDEALDALTKAAASALKTTGCAILLPDVQNRLTPRACYGKACKPEEILSYRVSQQAYNEKRWVSFDNGRESTDDAHRDECTLYEIGGLLAAPLIINDEAIGAITIFDAKPRKFSSADGDLLMSIALHAAVVLRKAEIFTTESTVAQTLQRSLVSSVPKTCRGVQFCGRYTCGAKDVRVGGDFYDVTPLPDGCVAVAMADVSGKGLNAAIHLAASKYMLKALARAYPKDPAAVLKALNEAINDCFEQNFFITLFHGVIDPEDRSLIFANAGHPPGIITNKAGGMHSCLLGGGIPLGTGWPHSYENYTAKLSHGDILLLYTDGVTDAIKDGERLELEGLHKMLFEIGPCSGDMLVSKLMLRLDSECGLDGRDDVAALTVMLEERAETFENKPIAVQYQRVAE